MEAVSPHIEALDFAIHGFCIQIIIYLKSSSFNTTPSLSKMMRLLSLSILLAVVPSCVATACTESTAEVYTIPGSDSGTGGSGSGGSGSSGGSSDTCANQCGNDVACYQSCAAIIAEGECNALALIDGGECTAEDDGLTKKMKARSTLDCSSSETCYILDGTYLACLDVDTGDYHDDNGNGNLNTGEYTSLNGDSFTVTGDATQTDAPEPTATSDGDSTPVSSFAAETTSSIPTTLNSAPITSQPKTTGTGTQAAAPTSTGGVERQRVGVVVGALGLVAGLVL